MVISGRNITFSRMKREVYVTFEAIDSLPVLKAVDQKVRHPNAIVASLLSICSMATLRCDGHGTSVPKDDRIVVTRLSMMIIFLEEHAGFSWSLYGLMQEYSQCWSDETCGRWRWNAASLCVATKANVFLYSSLRLTSQNDTHGS